MYMRWSTLWIFFLTNSTFIFACNAPKRKCQFLCKIWISAHKNGNFFILLWWYVKHLVAHIRVLKEVCISLINILNALSILIRSQSWTKEASSLICRSMAVLKSSHAQSVKSMSDGAFWKAKHVLNCKAAAHSHTHMQHSHFHTTHSFQNKWKWSVINIK